MFKQEKKYIVIWGQNIERGRINIWILILIQIQITKSSGEDVK